MTPHQHVEQLLAFIDASPSPWHVVSTIEDWLELSGFQRLDETQSWSLTSGERYFVIRGDSSIIAFIVGQQSLAETGFRIVGAHTDSPGLRIKPNPAHSVEGMLRLGVEVYGGPILATFGDRDLSLAGRLGFIDQNGCVKSQLIRFENPLVRLSNLAIHMNRAVNEEGLKYHKQTELPLLTGTINEQIPADYFSHLLKEKAGLIHEQILSWDLNVYDTQRGEFWGAKQEFFADSQLDNLASCHAGFSALLQESAGMPQSTLVMACFDHEEIGSCSSKGAEGSFLPDVLERVAMASALSNEQYRRALAKSFLVSADMAHAYHPNYPGAYEPEHKVKVNQGPVIKINTNQRYASESNSVAMFAQWCKLVDVPYQMYVHRTDLACGSTIGPMASAKLGVKTVDVGCPMWAMHSVRESAGVFDHSNMIKVLSCFFYSEKLS